MSESQKQGIRETPAWERLPALDGRANPCACCSPIPATLPLGAVIAVGFGSACVSRDGETVWRETPAAEWDELWSVSMAEARAAKDPDHDWRISMFGPLHGEEYQRQGEGLWVLVEKNQGFA